MDLTELKKTIKQRKITYKDIAEKSGLSLGTIKSIMSGKTANPRMDTLQAIYNALDMKYGTIKARNLEEIQPQVKVPLIGTIACGSPILAEENIIDYLHVDMRMHADFALMCKGDSMINARIFDGDIVYIRQQPDVENGQIAAVQIDDSATLKRVFKYPGKVVLRAENPLFPDIVITEEDHQEVRILGRAICFMSIIR